MSQGPIDQGPLRNWGCLTGGLFVVFALIVLLFPVSYAVWWLLHNNLW